MSEDSSIPASISFDRAQFHEAVPASVVCSSCNQVVTQSYYAFGDKIFCSMCRETRDRAMDGWGGGRFLRATLAGLGVGVVGAGVWYAIRALTDYELGLISIAIGYGVGKAVNWGSNGKGGWLYQLLAVFLTYTSIVTNYVPDIVEAVAEGGAPNVILYIVAFVVSYAAPVLMGFENIIGMLIIAFGLFEAWKLNKRVDVAITGPYTITPAATPVPNV
jgi:hypothetical protein